MSRITDYLEVLSLSEIESKLYLTLLESGPVTVRELASIVDMKRTTAYLYIDHLIEKGLIMKIVKGPMKLIAVVDPEVSLKKLVQDKIDTAVSLKNDFPTIVKHIAESLPEGVEVGDAEIKFYKGKNGVKKIYEEVLHAKEIRSYVNIEEVLGVFPENAELFDSAIRNRPDMIVYELIEDSQRARAQVEPLPKSGKYNFKILPKSTKIQSTDILIYDGTVSFINLKGNIDGVSLHNQDLYNNLKIIFELIWKLLPEPTNILP